MAKAGATRVLNRLLGKRVCFEGKFAWGEREWLKGAAEAQQGLVAEELDAAVDYLVLPDLSAGKTVQKKAASLNAKGAAVQVLDADAFGKLVSPTAEEVLALIRGGKDNAALLAKAVGGHRVPIYGAPPQPRVTIADESLDGSDLTRFDFSLIAFARCSFKGACVEGAVFADATECDFSGVTGASPQFFRVQPGKFVRADLKGPRFNSHLAGCDFTDARLEGAEISEQFWAANVVQQTAKGGPSFRGAFLRGAKLDAVRWDSPDFSGSDLSGAVLSNCVFTSANFASAKLAGATLVHLPLSDANFTNADLRGSNLAGADLTGAKLDGADLAGCNLRGAKLDGVDLTAARNYAAAQTAAGSAGPAVTELETVAGQAKRIQITFNVRKAADDEGEELGVDTSGLKYGYGLRLPASIGQRWRQHGSRTLSAALLELANLAGNRAVRFETVDVSSTKSPKGGKELRDLVTRAIAEAFAQPLPPEEELAKSAMDWREQQKEADAVNRERREAAKKLHEQRQAEQKQKVATTIAREVGKVTDIATFLKALELRTDKQKIAKATKMLKAERFKLFNDVTDEHVAGVVKSQSDPDLVYACRIDKEGAYGCCTQNLNVCGGLRGSVCKHLLVLIIGLVKAGELDPTTIDQWVAKSADVKASLDKEKMGEIFLRYKGAEAGEVDWRPTETVPEDYYAL